MGGGSADAAAVMLAIRDLCKLEVSDQEIAQLSKQVGADVPFFINGGCMRAQGIGEVLTACKPLEKGYILPGQMKELFLEKEIIIK